MTNNKQPSVELVFKQKASSIIKRGARGRVGLIIKDDTNKTFTTKTYKLSLDVDTDSKLYTTDNLQAIKDCFVGVPASVTVIRIDATTGKMADALKIVSTLKLDWIGSNVAEQADQTAISQFVKEMEKLNKQYKAVVFNPTTAPDCKHVVKLANTKVTFTDSRAERTGNEAIPTLLGIFAGLPLDRSATYYTLPNIKSVVEPIDIDTEIGNGGLVLFNDEDIVRISTAVNSLTTIDATNTEDMTRVEIVETMDLMYADITTTFRNDYIAKYKNKLDNQYLFISAVNGYFTALEDADILDKNFDNKALIDIERQRKLWLESGKTEAETWTDEQVMANTFKTNLVLSANVKMLMAMEDLHLIVNM